MKKKSIYYILFIVSGAFLLYFSGCRDNRSGEKPIAEDTLTQAQIDSAKLEKEFSGCDTFPVVNYKKITIDNYKQLREIHQEFGNKNGNKWKHKAFITLNRQELRFVYINETVIVPDTVINDMRAYSVFPQCWKGAANIPKIIVVSNEYQCYACYEFGHLLRFAAANTGKERTPTFPGRYSLVWKALERRSSLDSNWIMPYTWNFHEYAGNAFHKFTMPGRPVSHSCVRQFMDDAKWLFEWGEGAERDTNGKWVPHSGTPVLILGMFDYTRKKGGPWLDLKTNKDEILELPADPMKVEEALIPWCQIPDGSKSSIPDKERYRYAEDTLRARGVIREGVRLIHTINFNKLRREKAAREAKKKAEEERNRKEMLEKLQTLENQLEINEIKPSSIQKNRENKIIEHEKPAGNTEQEPR